MQCFDRWISHAYFIWVLFSYSVKCQGHYSHYSYYSLFAIRHYSLFAIRDCSLFAISDYSLFAIRYSGFPDTPEHQINVTLLRIPTGRPIASLQRVIEDLNRRLPRNKSRQWQGGGLEPGTSGLQHKRPKPLGQAASIVVLNDFHWNHFQLNLGEMFQDNPSLIWHLYTWTVYLESLNSRLEK